MDIMAGYTHVEINRKLKGIFDTTLDRWEEAIDANKKAGKAQYDFEKAANEWYRYCDRMRPEQAGPKKIEITWADEPAAKEQAGGKKKKK